LIALVIGVYWRLDYLADELKAERILSAQCRDAITSVKQAREKEFEQARVYEEQIDNLTVERDAIRLRERTRPSCVTVSANSAQSKQGASTVQLPQGDGLRAEWLLNFAERCERVRLQGQSIKDLFAIEE